MGCGFMKLDGYVNADFSDICDPDVKVDFNQLPWPFEDDEFQHIVAKDILEHLDCDKVPLTDIIKEMYRVSENGAVWEVQVPHHRSDHMWDDPTHKHPITPGTINLFNQKNLIEGYKIGRSDSPLAFEMNVDMDLCETKYTYVGEWIRMLKEKQITEEQLEFALHTQNNVAEATIMLIQIHKPGRYTIQELKDVISQKNQEKIEVAKELEK
jgi:ubiquinone/menaquinone biosynthesis C-methylase UbiE